MLADFFRPVTDPTIDLMLGTAQDMLGASTRVNAQGKGFPVLDGIKIALLGVPEYRGSVFNKPLKPCLDQVREKFYRLKNHYNPITLADLGDLIPGESYEDTMFALTEVLMELKTKKIIPVILGGSQDLTIAHYNCYKKSEEIINIVALDPRFDLGFPEDPNNSVTWLGKIVMQQPNYLFNFSNIGYQTYFVGAMAVELMDKMYFDAYRVGQVRSDITEMEPVIRTADMISVDMTCIRQSDAPGTCNPSPNGFTGEEICQAMMYAGLNDRLTGIGIYEMDGNSDRNDQTAHLAAQMIWYFIEGIGNRKNDLPASNHSGFMTYRVELQGIDQEIVFLKNRITDRWWIEVPNSFKNNRYNRHHFLPCSYKDYQQACKNEMPDRYWQAIQKME